MKTFDWRACFNKHPVFWDLAEDELASLLDDSLSREIICQPQQVIVREGDQGDSVFLIGEGEVNVLLKGDGEPGTGEYAVLLEIDGGPFREFLVKHPEIEFKIAAKLSERLRDLTEHVLTARFKDVDQKLELFNNRLDSELRVIDASMKATQAVFDQTNKRANEIIDSADRSRSRLTTTVTVAGGVITIIVTVLGFIGFNLSKELQDELANAKALEQTISALVERKKDIEAYSARMDKLEYDIEEGIKRFHLRASIPRLAEFFGEDDTKSAYELYEELMSLDKPEISIEVFKLVQRGLWNPTLRDGFIEFLKESVRRFDLTKEQTVTSYYLCLSAMVSVGIEGDEESYQRTLDNYRKSADEYREDGKRSDSIREKIQNEFPIEDFKDLVRLECMAASACGDDSDESSQPLPDEFESRVAKLTEIWEIVP
jgi:CRP-like cAMP-binding protein